MIRLMVIAALGGILVPAAAWAQGDVAAPQAAAAQAQPTATPRPGTAAPTPGASPSAKPPGGEASPAGAKPAEQADKKADEPAVVRRQSLAETQGNPAELSEAVLGKDGRVAFQFRNQGWPELIDWLAELAGEPLDWQELPGDRVNITTPGRYTVQEVVDLLNRHLLGRGYTLLALDGGMTVVKCATLNPAIVPRVAPEDLHSIPPHSFVRTSLDVGWLSAEKLAEELKPMISENGKLTALTTTNRIEAIDAAITLRQIAELLAREQNALSRESLVPEFKLRHIPADEAKRLLEQFLGVSNKPEPVLTPQQIQQAQQMQQMRAQQGGAAATPEPKKPEISIVANSRQNSILILAPPDRVAIATEFLKRIDVPGNTLTALADIQSRVQVFRLVSLDPEKLIEIVQEMNVLEATTRIRVDAANRALIVSGSAADRFIIDQLITRLDGSGRRLEVLQLRRLEAAEVAESISFLMGKKDKEDDSSRNRYPYYYFGNQGDSEKKKDDEFRVAANTRFRQVLLWATEAEMAEVRNLLVKLGELPPPGGSDRMIRVIDADVSPETYQYLRGLEQQWRRVAPNPLLLPDREAFEAASPDAGTATEDAATTTDEAESTPTLESQPDDKGDQQQPPQRVPEAGLTKTEPAALAAGLQSPTQGQAKPVSSDCSVEYASPEADTSRLVLQQPVLGLAGMQSAAGPADSAADDSDADRTGDIKSVEDFDRAFMSPPQQQRSAASDQATGRSGKPGATTAEPIRIELDAAGNLVLMSEDTAALDQLENVMLQFAPPKRAYHVFTTRYASAVWVTLNLEEYFEEEDAKDDNSNSFSRWYFGFDDSQKTKTPEGLGRPAKLRFIADLDTGTIVVSNASADQLRSIDELIRLWDVPEPVNKRTVRYQKLVALQYGKAGRVAETIKETYRDLLSSNDKAFQQSQGRQEGGGAAPQKNDTPRGRAFGGSELVDTGGGGQQGGGSDFSFKGKLSLGVDELGNTLLVSAEGEPLLKLVCDMIDQLDKASLASDGVRVVNLSASINAGALETALRTLRTATQTNGAENAKSPAADKPPAGNKQPVGADGPDG